MSRFTDWFFGRKTAPKEPTKTKTFVTPPLPPQEEIPKEVLNAIAKVHRCSKYHGSIMPTKDLYAKTITFKYFCQCGAIVTHVAPLSKYENWGVWREY